MKPSSVRGIMERPAETAPTMTLVEWAEVVLPLLALGWGLCVVAVYPETLDVWVAQFDHWWPENDHKTDGRSDESTRHDP